MINGQRKLGNDKLTTEKFSTFNFQLKNASPFTHFASRPKTFNFQLSTFN